MSNFIIVGAKRKRFNPYRATEYAVYTVPSLFFLWTAWYVWFSGDVSKYTSEVIWWQWPLIPLSIVGWVLALCIIAYACYVIWGNIVELVYWLRDKADNYGEVSD